MSILRRLAKQVARNAIRKAQMRLVQQIVADGNNRIMPFAYCDWRAIFIAARTAIRNKRKLQRQLGAHGTI